MKKTIIAGAAASAVLAAMPVVGVFAAQISGDLTVTDTVELTLDDNCTFSATSGTGSKNKVTLAGDGISGTFGTDTGTAGSQMTVSCNTKDGWILSANAADLKSGNDTIAFGKIDNTNTTTSKWSAKLTLAPSADANHATILGGWNEFNAEKTAGVGESQPVVQANGEAGAKEGVGALKITPYYQAYVASGQNAGTYTGDVVYTLHSNKTN